MEELTELRHYIESGKYPDALRLLDEMEEISRDDKINRISSFMHEELQAALHKAYDLALDSVSLEAFGGKYSGEEIDTMIHRAEVVEAAFEKIV